MTVPRLRLLIVDDEAALMQALCNILQQQGYDTVGCTSAEQALERMAGGRFDLMLTDLMMPKTDGLMLARSAQAADPEMVIVIMTGEGSLATAVEAMKTGVLDYVLKPFKLGTMLPVLQRALAIRELRASNAELQKKVQEHAQRLESANVELETANRELEAYAFTVSHDLRAPLRGIGGLSQLLAQRLAGKLSEETGRLLALISSRAADAQRLIEDLLRLSRVGRQPIERSVVDISAMARDVARELLAEWPDQQFDLDIAAAMPKPLADAALLRQVLLNLIGNAMKFTQDQPHAQIAMSSEALGSDHVYVIRDNGSGFDMSQADKLFKPFSRIVGSEGVDGSGVGLSIVQRIVLRHGGRIWAESAVGKGTTFYFTLAPRDEAR